MIATALNLNLKRNSGEAERKGTFIYSKMLGLIFPRIGFGGEKERLNFWIYYGDRTMIVAALLLRYVISRLLSSTLGPSNRLLKQRSGDSKAEKEKKTQNEIMTNKSIKKSRLISRNLHICEGERRERERRSLTDDKEYLLFYEQIALELNERANNKIISLEDAMKSLWFSVWVSLAPIFNYYFSSVINN